MTEGDFRGRYLVTGGFGFIGSNLVRALVDHGGTVVVIDALRSGSGANPYNLKGFENKVRIIRGDLATVPELAASLEGVDVVFDLAAQIGHAASMREPMLDLHANVTARLRLLEACREACPEARLLFTSTRQVYGRPRYLPVDEQHPIDPPDLNAVHKHAAEQYYHVYHKVYGLSTTVLRLTNCYGPRMRVADARQTFVGIWVRQVLEGKPVSVFGDGRQLRDLTYVDDVVAALLRAVSADGAVGAVMNIGGELTSLRDLAELLVETNGGGSVRMEAFPKDRAAIDIGDYHGDDGLAREVLKWEPRIGLRKGLETTLAYYREHGEAYWDA